MARLFSQLAISSLLSFYCKKYFRFCPESIHISKSAKDSPIEPRRPPGRTVSSLAEPWRRGSGFGGMIVRHNAQILPRRSRTLMPTPAEPQKHVYLPPRFGELGGRQCQGLSFCTGEASFICRGQRFTPIRYSTTASKLRCMLPSITTCQ